MNTATTNSMNFLLQKNNDRINSAIPKSMRDLMKKLANKKNMSESTYIKLAINNQIIQDLEEES